MASGNKHLLREVFDRSVTEPAAKRSVSGRLEASGSCGDRMFKTRVLKTRWLAHTWRREQIESGPETSFNNRPSVFGQRGSHLVSLLSGLTDSHLCKR